MSGPVPAKNNADGKPPMLARPAARWGALAAAVAAAHGLIFWTVADKHFLPRDVSWGAPASRRADFAARERKMIDPQTGRETALIREYDVSTRLAGRAKAAGKASPAPQSGASSTR